MPSPHYQQVAKDDGWVFLRKTKYEIASSCVQLDTSKMVMYEFMRKEDIVIGSNESEVAQPRAD